MQLTGMAPLPATGYPFRHGVAFHRRLSRLTFSTTSTALTASPYSTNPEACPHTSYTASPAPQPQPQGPSAKRSTGRLNDVEAWDKSQLNWTRKMINGYGL
jgi:hypothetical protein